MLKDFQNCRSLNLREWLNVEIQVCWNPTTLANAHFKSKCKIFALVFLRLSRMKTNSLISTYCFYLKGLKTCFYYLNRKQPYFIQISLASFCEGCISSCMRFSIKLQTFNHCIYFWSHRVYFVVHICLLNPLITQSHPPLENSKSLIGFNHIFCTSRNFLKAVTFS